MFTFLNIGGQLRVSQFQSFSVGVVSLLFFVQMTDKIIDQENVEILTNEVKQEPITETFKVVH